MHHMPEDPIARVRRTAPLSMFLVALVALAALVSLA